MRMLAPLGLGEKRLALAEVWHYYEVSPNRRELAPSTLESKRNVWMHFARWMEEWYPEATQLAHVTSDAVGEYLVELRNGHTASTYNNRVCVLREMFRVLADRAGLVDDPWEGVVLLSDDSHPRRELGVDELKRLLFAAEHYGRDGVPSPSVGRALVDDPAGRVTRPCVTATITQPVASEKLCFEGGDRRESA